MQIEVITPEKTAVDEDCRLAVVPTAGGELGIEEGHAHMMATLTPGELRVYIDEHADVYAISGGVMDVRPKRILVMADAVEKACEIDLDRAHQARERAERRLEKPADGVDIDRAEQALARAINRIRVANRAGEPGE